MRVLTQGPDATTATAQATEQSAPISSEISGFDAEGIVEKWSQGALTTWSNRPWKDDGTQGDPVFNSSVTFQITFVDFEALAQWLARAGSNDAIELQSVVWGLSTAEEKLALDVVRVQAVRNAHDKALAYARAAGLDTVKFEEVADSGMLSTNHGQGSGPGGMPVLARSAMYKESGSLEVRPEEVVISVSVDARFSANRNI